ncbi:hypothetical protein [Bacteroides faecalis]|uniref:Uncharacterized protein n=1 Tax=Bacteroides faecalis TaxID=2447885 RepID=A0A401LUE6_9BACE|nr:hypothetical protein [Bacteroides faecalis]GCB35200.1 hypothetical protein KGMB02408_21450 [Bacteroides faecalis]
MYKYHKTIKNGSEKLIDGIENIEMFLDDNNDWNFHDSEIHSFHWDRDTKTFTVSVELIGCGFPELEGWDGDAPVILDFHFEGCVEVHMPNVDLWSPQYIYEIGISIYNKYLE